MSQSPNQSLSPAPSTADLVSGQRRAMMGTDWAIALVLGSLNILLVFLMGFDVATYEGTGGPLFWVWNLALFAALPWRRTHPTQATIAFFAVAGLQVFAGPMVIFPADMVALIFIYTAAVYGKHWVHLGAIIASQVGAIVVAVRSLILSDSLSVALTIWVLIAALTLAAWAVGFARRGRATRMVLLQERALTAEQTAAQQYALATAAERTRIAREMHDVVAHSLSVVIAQSDGGRYAATTDPGAAVQSLETIGETARSALADMRRILGVLREDPNSPSGADPDVAPAPSAENLQQLMDTVRSSGVNISHVVVGSKRLTPPGIGVTIYRICQEALTNILKHAGPNPSVTLLEKWEPGAVVVEISDDGRGAAAPKPDGAGHGLIGMRERAALFGGTLSAGPKAGGGWRVQARIPLPTTSSEV